MWAKRDIDVCNATCKILAAKMMKETSGGGLMMYLLYLFLLLLLVGAVGFFVYHTCVDGACSQEWCSIVVSACKKE